MNENALAIMIKYPEAGQVKSRLAAVIGREPARDLYEAFILDLRDHLCGDPAAYDTYWAVSPPEKDYVALLHCRPELLIPQQGDTLNIRMLRVFQALLDRGYQRVVMIGSDLPHLEQETITLAFAMLEHTQIVLAPSADGGYYLIGMNGFFDVVSGITMSTPTVFEETCQLLHQQGRSFGRLPVNFDIDTVGDLPALAGVMAQLPPARLVRTRAMLDRVSGRKVPFAGRSGQ